MTFTENKSKAKKKSTDAALRSVHLYRRLASILPNGIVTYFTSRLCIAGIKEDVRIWLGRQLLFSIIMGLSLILFSDFYMLYTATPIPPIFIWLPAVILIFFAGIIPTLLIIYLTLYFKVADRTSQVEKILPDFLSLTVSNLRAGMTPFAAFIHAARPEFGDFSSEVKAAAARASGSKTLVDALGEINQNFSSPILSRIVNLFSKGMKSGAQLSKLLNSSAEEIRHIQDLRLELASSTKTYTVFLGFIIVVVLPFLLSVSNQFITVFVSLNVDTTHSASTAIANVPSFSGKVGIRPPEMFNISIGMLVLTSVLVSTLVGLIGRGKALYGLKYFPVFAIASIGMFLFTRIMIAGIFSAFSG